MRTVMLALVTVLVTLPVVAPGAQVASPSGTVDVSATELQALMKLGVNNPIKSVDAGKHTVFLWYETRKPGAGARGANGSPLSEFHTELTEIYLIVRGAATIRTGGKVLSSNKAEVPGLLPGTNFPRFPSPLFRVQAEGGMSRRVATGDMLVIPPNTPHAWESVDPPELSYVIFRIDPEHRLQAGFVHPELGR
jgi:hypothetical protein